METYLNIGVELSSLGKRKEAIKAYKQGLLFDPNSFVLYSNLGVEYADLGKYNQALRCHKKALGLNTYYDNGWYNLACTYALMGRQDKALRALKIAIKLNEENRKFAAKDPDFMNIKGTKAFQDLIEG